MIKHGMNVVRWSTEFLNPGQIPVIALDAHQSGIWCTSEQNEQHTPIPQGWGWSLSEDGHSWMPVWNTLPTASKACSELVKCGCKSKNGCSGRCKKS